MRTPWRSWSTVRQLLGGLVAFLVLWWLFGLWRLRDIVFTRGSRGDDESGGPADAEPPGCIPIPSEVYRRPDPMIYSQRYLMDQGLAVTWDNPDIHLELGGAPVPSSDLIANTEYEIVARIWNGSNIAPAVNLPVRFSYLDFGIGTVSVPIDTGQVDLPVNGAPGHPAFARMKWTAPARADHYCLQVEALWTDDANPANNLGQENIHVKKLNSPHAHFDFPVRNDTLWPQKLRLELDAYRIAAPARCGANEVAESPTMSKEETAAHRRYAVDRHGRGKHPAPDGWRVTVDPREFDLRPGEEQQVDVDITAPDGFTGSQSLNVNAFDGERLAGGVTLFVTSDGG